MGAKETCILCSMGLEDYGGVWDLQKKLHAMRVRREIPDVLLLLEHPPTLTVGKSGSLKNVLVSPEILSAMGISLFFIERGGDVTYHGPGQLVGYPIMDLRKRGKDIYQFVTDLEEVMIRTVRDFSVDAGRDPGHRGVWTREKELGAIGISVRRWVTMHGFALNICTNLNHFTLINPCGFTDRQATSMAACLASDFGIPVGLSVKSVRDQLVSQFAAVFDVDLVPATVEEVREMGKEQRNGSE